MLCSACVVPSVLFFFTPPATTDIYTLSLHDALPICPRLPRAGSVVCSGRPPGPAPAPCGGRRGAGAPGGAALVPRRPGGDDRRGNPRLPRAHVRRGRGDRKDPTRGAAALPRNDRAPRPAALDVRSDGRRLLRRRPHPEMAPLGERHRPAHRL